VKHSTQHKLSVFGMSSPEVSIAIEISRFWSGYDVCQSFHQACVVRHGPPTDLRVIHSSLVEHDPCRTVCYPASEAEWKREVWCRVTNCSSKGIILNLLIKKKIL